MSKEASSLSAAIIQCRNPNTTPPYTNPTPPFPQPPPIHPISNVNLQAIRSAASGLPAPAPEAFPLGMSKEAFSLAAAMIRRLRLSDAATPSLVKRQDGVGRDQRGLGVGGVGKLEGGWEATLGGEEGTGAGAGGQPVVEGFLKKRRSDVFVSCFGERMGEGSSFLLFRVFLRLLWLMAFLGFGALL